jgi:hypothetical protein
MPTHIYRSRAQQPDCGGDVAAEQVFAYLSPSVAKNTARTSRATSHPHVQHWHALAIRSRNTRTSVTVSAPTRRGRGRG